MNFSLPTQVNTKSWDFDFKLHPSSIGILFFNCCLFALTFILCMSINWFTLFLTLLSIQLGALIVLKKKKDKKKLHSILLYTSQLYLIITIVMWIAYNTYVDTGLRSVTPAFTDFYFYHNLFVVPSFNFEFALGIDSISLLFLLLTNLFIYLCILSLPTYQERFNEIMLYLIFLQWGLILSFCVLDLFGFFIFFEMTLIPIYFLVLIWGSRERKIRASYLISIYTLFGSIFMFFTIIYLYNKIGTTNYLYLTTMNFNLDDQFWLWLFFFCAFAAKIPMFPFHIWLPEAHVEAPTVGSVLLAALLLKLGTYGLIRFSLILFPEGTLNFNTYISIFALISIIYTSLIAIRQIDLKKIIAYSSVGHMNVVLLGIIIINVENLEGAIFQMISHGIVSGALFFCIGSFYKRYKVRSLKYFGGFMQINPLLSVIFLIFSMANISFPGTSSFVGEFVLLIGLFSNTSLIVLLASINMVTGAVYTLWAYNRIAFGNIKNLIIKDNLDLTRNEFYIFAILIYFLLLLGLQPNVVFDLLHWDCMNIIEHIKLSLI